MDKIDNLYSWDIDVNTGFRKLNFRYETNYLKESEKYVGWIGLTKKCRTCDNLYPETEYFFKLKGERGLANKCKLCDGYKFAWGKNKKYDLIKSGSKYCQKCDTIYPLNLLFYNKNKHSKSDGFASYCKNCVSNCEFKIHRHLNSLILDKKESYKICLDCYYELPNTKEYYFGLCSSDDRLEYVCKSCQHGKYGIVYVDKVYFSGKGTKCLSYYELLITEWLEVNKVNFEKEVFYRDVIKNDNSLRRFDWVIYSKSNVYYVELFGLANFQGYAKNMQNKIYDCRINNINLVELYPEDLKRPLNEVFSFLLEDIKEVV